MATTEIPSQREAALERAQAVRFAAIAVKRELKAGELTIAAALADPRAGPIKAVDLLAAQSRWGRERACRLLADVRVPENRRVRDMDARTRLVIGAAVLNNPPPLAGVRLSAKPAAKPPRVVRELVGRYQANGEDRRVVLVVEQGGRVLYDRGPSGERLVERFAPMAGLLEIAAVANGYLDEMGGS